MYSESHDMILTQDTEQPVSGHAATLRRLAAAAEAWDPATWQHTDRVAEYAAAIGQRMGLDARQVGEVRVAGLLHDIGKIGVCEDIIRKPGRLNAYEEEVIKSHPTVGFRIMSALGMPGTVLSAVHEHHERYDGTGYPRGLAGEDICFTARIIAAADAIDAMLSDRPYRKGLPVEEVVRVLEQGAGTQFDPRVATAALQLFGRGLPGSGKVLRRHHGPTPVPECNTVQLHDLISERKGRGRNSTGPGRYAMIRSFGAMLTSLVLVAALASCGSGSVGGSDPNAGQVGDQNITSDGAGGGAQPDVAPVDGTPPAAEPPVVPDTMPATEGTTTAGEDTAPTEETAASPAPIATTTTATPPAAGTPATQTGLTAYGTAVIDGVVDTKEWANAARMTFEVRQPSADGGGTTPAVLYVMNDKDNLYLAVMITRRELGGAVSVFFEFDNDGDCTREDGDDVFGVSAGRWQTASFYDDYRYTCPGSPAGSVGCGPGDTTVIAGFPAPGTNDGAGDATNDGTYTMVEMSHPLDSGDDGHDFRLRQGDTVNYFLSVRLFSYAIGQNYADTDHIPGRFCSSPNGAITVAANAGALRQHITIDIKPGGGLNSINPYDEGTVPVAILSRGNFDAPADVDATTLTFGRTGDEASLAFCNVSGEDVNSDGLRDLVCHFTTMLTGFKLGDLDGILKGRTVQGAPFTGSDTVRIVQ